MQTKKMSLANLPGRLNRNEMKNVTGGNAACVTCSDGSLLCAGSSTSTCTAGTTTVSCTNGDNTTIYACPRSITPN